MSMGYVGIYPQTKTGRYGLYRALQRHLYLVSSGLPDSFWMDKGIPPTPTPPRRLKSPLPAGGNESPQSNWTGAIHDLFSCGKFVAGLLLEPRHVSVAGRAEHADCPSSLPRPLRDGTPNSACVAGAPGKLERFLRLERLEQAPDPRAQGIHPERGRKMRPNFRDAKLPGAVVVGGAVLGSRHDLPPFRFIGTARAPSRPRAVSYGLLVEV
jgi:hypothetical protein